MSDFTVRKMAEYLLQQSYTGEAPLAGTYKSLEGKVLPLHVYPLEVVSVTKGDDPVVQFVPKEVPGMGIFLPTDDLKFKVKDIITIAEVKFFVLR